MTAVGKILVFINLIFSLIVGGFVIAVYTARTHWESEYKKLEARYTVAQASERAAQSATDEAKRAAKAETDKVKADMARVQADLEMQITANNDLRKKNNDLVKQTNKQGAVSSAQLADVTIRQADVDQLRKTLKDETEKNAKLVDENAHLRGEAVTAQVQAKSLKDMNLRLEKQIQDMARDMTRAGRGTATAANRATGQNPPPESVEGLIKTMDPTGRLVTLTIGSDAGLSRGHTLQVFRLSPIPSQSKYLGTLRIIEVSATQAVAEPMGRLSAPLQVGDRVASRILGGS
jgi:hypothetical protein